MIAEYQILESGCPLDSSKVVCSSIYLNKEVKCKEQNRIWIQSTNTCECRAGFFEDAQSKLC